MHGNAQWGCGTTISMTSSRERRNSRSEGRNAHIHTKELYMYILWEREREGCEICICPFSRICCCNETKCKFIGELVRALEIQRINEEMWEGRWGEGGREGELAPRSECVSTSSGIESQRPTTSSYIKPPSGLMEDHATTTCILRGRVRNLGTCFHKAGEVVVRGFIWANYVGRAKELRRGFLSVSSEVAGWRTSTSKIQFAVLAWARGAADWTALDSLEIVPYPWPSSLVVILVAHLEIPWPPMISWLYWHTALASLTCLYFLLLKTDANCTQMKKPLLRVFCLYECGFVTWIRYPERVGNCFHGENHISEFWQGCLFIETWRVLPTFGNQASEGST